MAPDIHLMHNSDSFNSTEVEATTVGALKTELGVASTSRVNVNTTVAQDSTSLNDGDIVAVFSPDTAPRGGIYATLQAAIEAGGRKLDAFDTMLPDIYETVGFRPVARVKWNDEFAPKPPFAAKAWDKKTFSEFNNGEPDIILFVYDPKYFGGVDKNSLTLFDDFDEAAKIQDAELAKMGGG